MCLRQCGDGGFLFYGCNCLHSSHYSLTGAVRFEVVVEYTDGNLQSQRFTIPTVTAIAEITDLNPGVKYRICIIAFGNSLETSASAKSSVIIQRTMVSPPTNIKVDNFGQDFVSMSWDPSEGKIMVSKANQQHHFSG